MKTKKEITLNKSEKMEMRIELADNGIILRDEDCNVHVVMHGESTKNADYGYKIDHTPERKAIGSWVYEFLMESVLPEHEDELSIVGFDIEIIARPYGYRDED